MNTVEYLLLTAAVSAIVTVGVIIIMTLLAKKNGSTNTIVAPHETCPRCAFWCPNCGCIIAVCKPIDCNALIEDGVVVPIGVTKTVKGGNGGEVKISGKFDEYGE